jgi:hypothetical protein
MTKFIKFTGPAFLVLLWLMAVLGANFKPFGNSTDNGFIVSMDDFNITIQGELGRHEFEILGPCTWCELGEEVQVNFLSVSRASMTPGSSPYPKPPVNLIIIRDGREEDSLN